MEIANVKNDTITPTKPNKIKNIWWDTFPLLVTILLGVLFVLTPSPSLGVILSLIVVHFWLFRFANKEGFWQGYVFIAFPPYSIYYAIKKYKQLKPLTISYFILIGLTILVVNLK